MGSGYNLGSIEVIGHRNDTMLLSFWSWQALKMAQCGWMAKKLNRGVTYQHEAKDMADVWEYLNMG